MKDVYAIFNLEIDPDNFQFAVALGGLMTGDPDPGSTWVEIHSLEDQVACSVFIQSGQPGRRGPGMGLLRKKLEVISPVDRDGLEFECQRQLSLALRLFKSSPFWVMPWKRRNEVRVWPPPPTSYGLHGREELRRFCEFSKKLFPFHVRRNLYHNQGGLGKAEILRVLDRAVFDEKEVVVFRLKANEFWGFGESPDEHLYSMG